MNFKTGKEFASELMQQIQNDRVMDQAAKLAFYFLLSIFPLLIFLISLLGLFLQRGTNLQTIIYAQLTTIAPESAIVLIKKTLSEIQTRSNSLNLSLALLFTWWSATQAMQGIIEGLNIAYRVKSIGTWWQKYIRATLLTLMALLLSAVTILIFFKSGKMLKMFSAYVGVLIIFQFIYRYGSQLDDNRHRSHIIGTFIGVIAWLIVSFGLKVYLTHFDRFTMIYGSIGAVIILMSWFYLTGASILLGGIVNAIIKRRENSSIGSF
jgi:membrane protein